MMRYKNVDLTCHFFAKLFICIVDITTLRG